MTRQQEQCQSPPLCNAALFCFARPQLVRSTPVKWGRQGGGGGGDGGGDGGGEGGCGGRKGGNRTRMRSCVERILMFDGGVLATLKTDYPKMSIVCGKTTAFGHLVTSLQNALGPIYHKRYKGEHSCS